MDTTTNKRLQDLFSLYNRVSDTILGHPPEDRTELLRLKKAVAEEIREIHKNRLQASA